MTLSLTKRLEKGALANPNARITAEEYDADVEAVETAVNSVIDSPAEAQVWGRALGAGAGGAGWQNAAALRNIIGEFTDTVPGIVPESETSDGSQILWDNGWAEPPAAGGTVNIAQYDIFARLASGSGVGTGVAAEDLTEEEAPAAGFMLVGWASAAAGAEIQVVDVDNLPLPAAAGALAARDDIETGQINSSAYATSGDITTGTDNAKILTVLRGIQLVQEHGSVGFASVEDTNDYSSSPYTVTSVVNQYRWFSDAHDHIIEFPSGLATAPAARGEFEAPAANTLTIQRVAGSGVSINNVASDGFAWVVPAGGRVTWKVKDTNTIRLDGDFAGAITVPGATTFEDNVLLEGSISGGGLIKVARGGSEPAVTVADSEKKIVTAGSITAPTTALGDGGFVAWIKFGSDTHDIILGSTGNKFDVSALGFVAGNSALLHVVSATEVDLIGSAGEFDQTDLVSV